MYFLHIHEYGTLTTASHFKSGREKRKNNGGDEPNESTLYACMEMSQQNPL
jgi:hypothetical protein